MAMRFVAAQCSIVLCSDVESSHEYVREVPAGLILWIARPLYLLVLVVLVPAQVIYARKEERAGRQIWRRLSRIPQKDLALSPRLSASIRGV